ncbi:hypothetical protein NC653_031529 [Populus alba x Populus x berolinensis]|uniref:Uncharacterized protein n=1 Tax=Populus alba x Populus x berolinensis TaxID=444605 RepID=A0AAD6Q1L2_9ROSI|nr:hypothetical protein NC653_031529 [Populus alba x Populus x berolinensis]
MSWPSMPTIALVVDIIASHPEHDIVIGIDTLGKEELLIHISRVLNIKVRPERLQTMHILGFHDTFTTKTSLTRVQAVPHNSFSIETLEGLDTMRPTIGIMPSGLPWVPKPVKGDVNLFGSLLTSCYKKRQSSDKLDVAFVVETNHQRGSSTRMKGKRKAKKKLLSLILKVYLKFYRAVVDELHHELSNTRSPYLNLI